MKGCNVAIAAVLAAVALAAPAAPPEPHADAIADEILANVAKLKAADPLAEPMAFWDFDGTIVEGDISTGLVRDGKEVFPGLIRMAIEAGYSPVYRGKEGADLFLDVEYPRFSKIGRWLAWPLIGQIFHGADAEEMDRFCRRRAEETFAPWVFAASKRIIDRLAAAGVENYIISGSPDIFVKPSACIAGIRRDRAVGIRTVAAGGRLTTQIVYPAPMNEGKVEVLRETMQERPHAYAVAAFGNSYWTDGPFLEYVVSHPLPGGVKGIAMMVNGGTPPARYEGLFRCVGQKATVGGPAE